MPYEVANELPKLSKRRLRVFVNGGDRAADPLVYKAFKQGFPLVAIVDGRYPAWVNATDR